LKLHSSQSYSPAGSRCDNFYV